MARFAILLLVALFGSPLLAEEPPAFPPIGDRYDTIPADAKAVVKALKKLQAKTEIGINFKDYNEAVSDVYPDVKLFIESPESKNMPELRLVLKNATDCYLKVRELWSTKISSDNPNEKYDASILLITAQPLLWKVAAGNVAAGDMLIETPKEDLPKAHQSLLDSLKLLDAANALETAKAQTAELLKKDAADRDANRRAAGRDAAPNELKELLFKDGNLGEGIANIEGAICKDIAEAKKAYDSETARIGRGGKIATGLGEASWATPFPDDGMMDVVFRRKNFVVVLRVQSKNLAELTKRAKAVDSRIMKHLASEAAKK